MTPDALRADIIARRQALRLAPLHADEPLPRRGGPAGRRAGRGRAALRRRRAQLPGRQLELVGRIPRARAPSPGRRAEGAGGPARPHLAGGRDPRAGRSPRRGAGRGGAAAGSSASSTATTAPPRSRSPSSSRSSSSSRRGGPGGAASWRSTARSTATPSARRAWAGSRSSAAPSPGCCSTACTSPRPPRRGIDFARAPSPRSSAWSRGDRDGIAAVVLEPLLQGAAGMRIYGRRVPPAGPRALRRRDVLLVIDEVFTGYGRTGPMWASRPRRRQPRPALPGEGLHRRHAPHGRDAGHRARLRAFLGAADRAFYYGHSYCGNPLGAAMAREVLAVYREEQHPGARRPQGGAASPRPSAAMGSLPGRGTDARRSA